MDLKKYIASIEDFPKKGIIFRDVTPLLLDRNAFKYSVDKLSQFGNSVGANIIIGPEARGFIFGCPVAYEMDVAFAPVRKPGKLPRETVEADYDLEYGKNTLCMHKDSIKKGDKVLIVDDLLATGGTAQACIELVKKLGGTVVGFACIIELSDLKGRDTLDCPVYSLMTYEGA